MYRTVPTSELPPSTTCTLTFRPTANHGNTTLDFDDFLLIVFCLGFLVFGFAAAFDFLAAMVSAPLSADSFSRESAPSAFVVSVSFSFLTAGFGWSSSATVAVDSDTGSAPSVTVASLVFGAFSAVGAGDSDKFGRSFSVTTGELTTDDESSSLSVPVSRSELSSESSSIRSTENFCSKYACFLSAKLLDVVRPALTDARSRADDEAGVSGTLRRSAT
mmetsp:Transcript_8157/g.11878  ORF Transcript_8157/g.11878 Transcript_8157/m.11878 type:complete len:218 (-) Transcript_8157:1069-1722(-)